MGSNSRRIFESIVSVDAWHTEFSTTDATASVHADVSFLKGRLGDEPESPVRFEIMLKRAEIVFVIPQNEPLTVLQSSVRREPPAALTVALSRQSQDNMGIEGAARLDLLQGSGALKAGASASRNVSTTRTHELKKESGEIVWAQSKTGEGHYRWEVAPALAPTLLGKVWNAVSEPILQIRGQRPGYNPLEGVCRIEIRCRREDIQIDNVVFKDRRGLHALLGMDKRMVAVEAYIRNALSSRNLDIRNFEDPFGHICLADVFVEKQVT